MTTRFTSQSQSKLFAVLRAKINLLGYQNSLLADQYSFVDWFAPERPERIARTVAFGQTPYSYDTACIAILLPNGSEGSALIQEFRALGAPFAFEVGNDSIKQWSVGLDSQSLENTFTLDEIDAIFAQYANLWKPNAILRMKNVSLRTTPIQLGLFDHSLIPALESRIRETLEPTVKNACAVAVTTYRETANRDPDGRQLFRLAFWLLAGKVFSDRGITPFSEFSSSATGDDVLEAVAKHYAADPKPRLLNHATRDAAYRRIWNDFDFRNLSIEILTHFWTNMFVTPDVRAKLGIHPTPRTIAKFIVDALPFEDFPEQHRTVLEPCCGSATFLVAAMQRLRDLLRPTMSPEARHSYLKKHLIGFEQESFGIEISRLCLTLSDFPNPNGWQLHESDVFADTHFTTALGGSRIVVCNPPFEDFEIEDRERYSLQSVKKPAELLNRVLSHLHPDGVLGFVMPRLIVDGRGYKQLRKTLAGRFSDIAIVTLPDNAFSTSDQETALVICRSPHKSVGGSVRVKYDTVSERDWHEFATTYKATTEEIATKSAAEITSRFTIPELGRVWHALAECQTLGEIAKLHRGIEWNEALTNEEREETGNRKVFVRDKEGPGYKRGVPPKAKPLYAFQSPPLAYLNMRQGLERGNSFGRDWTTPKIIMNKATKSRGKWRIAAFSDYSGLAFYQTFTGVWPTDPSMANALAAVLNGPVANAFVSVREGKTDITSDTLRDIPVPKLQDAHIISIENAMSSYLQSTEQPDEIRDFLLKKIDAAVLEAYDLPPRIERELLDFFGDSGRPVPFKVGRYFPSDFEPFLPLRYYLSNEFSESSAERWMARQPAKIQPHIIDALNAACGVNDE